MTRDARIDDYIARQADFARPILGHIRRVVHAACPEVEEAIKWNMPAFLYKGKQLAGMAAFKAHATLGFWQRSGLCSEESKAGAMGDFGRLTAISDLPDDAALAALIYRGMALIDEGAKTVRNKTAKPALEPPADLTDALAAVPAARTAFDAFPPGCRREYVVWVVEAKRPETRARRIAQAVEWIAQGKKRNWKYEGC